ncbi:hypothetical protein CUREO_0851 [Campylobacter ureolyticus RIGS 9880]|uniref:Uncharacterized protein n=1 Tax=Campylobacter ureolyticus RIGS 9880 TaxID=1032069 RepID=A0AAU8U8M5_9BACT|nr:hypothetical protein CUREO_0851 [Campylobacter ureolyticus RIGS 9880]
MLKTKTDEKTGRKNLYLELSKNIRLNIKKSLKKRKRHQKKLRDKYMVGVVLGLHRLFFICKSSIKENIFMKKVYFMV